MELKHKHKLTQYWINGEKPRLYYETVKLVRHWFRLPRAVHKERIVTNISIRVSTYINKTKHFRKWEGAAPREVVEETAPVVKL